MLDDDEGTTAVRETDAARAKGREPVGFRLHCVALQPRPGIAMRRPTQSGRGSAA